MSFKWISVLSYGANLHIFACFKIVNSKLQVKVVNSVYPSCAFPIKMILKSLFFHLISLQAKLMSTKKQFIHQLIKSLSIQTHESFSRKKYVSKNQKILHIFRQTKNLLNNESMKSKKWENEIRKPQFRNTVCMNTHTYLIYSYKAPHFYSRNYRYFQIMITNKFFQLKLQNQYV